MAKISVQILELFWMVMGTSCEILCVIVRKLYDSRGSSTADSLDCVALAFFSGFVPIQIQ